MIGIDLIGLAVTAMLAGPSLSPQLVAAAFIQEGGRLAAALAAGGAVQAVMAGGLFGRTTAVGAPAALVLLAGPVTLLAAAAATWGVEGPRQLDLWLPWSRARRPFAAACCRMAALSLIQCLWALLVRGTIP